MVGEKPDDTFPQLRRLRSPRMAAPPLRQGGKEIEQVEAYDEEVVGETQHFIFGQCDEVRRGGGDGGSGIAGLWAEEHVGLQEQRGGECLLDEITVVVALHGESELAADKKEKLTARVAGLDDRLALRELQEAELGVTGHLHQLGTAHALKQLEAEQKP